MMKKKSLVSHLARSSDVAASPSRSRSRFTGSRVAVAAVIAIGAFLGSTGEAQAVEKKGPIMLNMKIGPAIKLDDIPTQFALEVEGAYAFDRAKNAYIGFNPQFQFSDPIITINLPLTFQYDIELPVEGLYLYPKINAGVAIHTGSGDAAAAFALQPEFGIKYQIVDIAHVGFEPFSLPFYLGQKGNGFDIQYRLFFYGGLDL